MQNKKVQRKSNGSIRVYRSNSSYNYVDYPSFWHYEHSNDYSQSESVHDVNSFDGFSGGDFGGGGSGGSYDSSSSDSGGGDGGGGGD